MLLALVYGVIGFGLTSILRWTLGRLLGQLRASLELFARAIPLLMIFSVVLFLTVEMWEVFSDLPTASFVGLAVLFVVLGTSFLVARVPREVRAIERDAGADAPPLDSSERVNVGLVMFVSQALQVLSVSVAIGAFFAAVGVLVIDEQQTAGVDRRAPDVLVEFTLFDHEAIVTAELLRVAGGDRRLHGPLLRDLDADRRRLPPRVPGGAHLGDAAELPRPRRVPEAALDRLGFGR